MNTNTLEGKIVFPLNPNVKSPTFIASADIHLGKKPYNIPELEADLRDNLVRLVDLTITKEVDYLVIAGDLYEDNRGVKPNMIAFVANQIDKLRDHGIRTVGIAGDHDKPVQGEAWIHVSRVEPVTVEPAFAGLDYFDYSLVSPDDLINLLKDKRDSDQVLWIFLHCQFPQLFNRTVPKKLVDYNNLKLFETFPNIQGIIAGDIHAACETRAYGVGHEAYVGYPGSLGINDKSEYAHDKHVLWCDGKNLMHLPFQLVRQHCEIDFRGKLADDFDVSIPLDWAKQQLVKPLIFLFYDMDSQNQMHKLAPLYDHALIKEAQAKAEDLLTPDETLEMSCRSSTSTDEKVDEALRYYCGNDDGLHKLASSLLKDDVKITLDKFKEKFKL